MALTPDMLRDAAAILAIDHSGPRWEFMCHCLTDVLGEEPGEARRTAEDEFDELLENHGVSTGGSLCDEQGIPLRVHLNDDEFAIQCVRFHLLHLFAHMLEG